MADTLDIGEILDAALRAKPPRGDEAYAHVSDLYGCDLATWARRSGLPELPFLPQTLVKFELGHAVEAFVADAIAAQYPRAIRNERLGWDPVTGACAPLGEDEAPPPGWLVGHTDLDLPDGPLLEIKSTVFWGGKEPQDAQRHYVEQTAGCATARRKATFGIIEVDRSSGKVVPFWFDAADYREWARERAIEVLHATNPTNAAPAPAPRTDWACKTCRYAACSQNRNPARLDAAPTRHLVEDLQ